MYGQGAQAPSIEIIIICLMSIFPSYFFLSILGVKTGKMEVNRNWKMAQ